MLLGHSILHFIIIDVLPSRFTSSVLWTGSSVRIFEHSLRKIIFRFATLKITWRYLCLSGHFFHVADGISEFMGTRAGFMRPCKNQMGLLAIQYISLMLACHVNLLLMSMRTIIPIKEKMLIMYHSSAFQQVESQSESKANVKGCLLLQNSLPATVTLLINARSDELRNLPTRWETISLSMLECAPASGDSEGWAGKPSYWVDSCLGRARRDHWASARMCLKS